MQQMKPCRTMMPVATSLVSSREEMATFSLESFAKNTFLSPSFGECLDIILHNIQVVHGYIAIVIMLIALMIDPRSNERSFESLLSGRLP